MGWVSVPMGLCLQRESREPHRQAKPGVTVEIDDGLWLHEVQKVCRDCRSQIHRAIRVKFAFDGANEQI
jgi:hypothetical protein